MGGLFGTAPRPLVPPFSAALTLPRRVLYRFANRFACCSSQSRFAHAFSAALTSPRRVRYRFANRFACGFLFPAPLVPPFSAALTLPRRVRYRFANRLACCFLFPVPLPPRLGCRFVRSCIVDLRRRYSM